MSLLPNAMRLPDDVPKYLGQLVRAVKKNEPMRASASDWSSAQASDKPPKMVRLRLTDDSAADNEDFEAVYGDRGCECFISAPCGCCTHPGNPLALECNDDAWVMGHQGQKS